MTAARADDAGRRMAVLVVTIAPYALPDDIARCVGLAAGNRSALDALRILRVRDASARPHGADTETVAVVVRGDPSGALGGAVASATLLRDAVTLPPGWKSLVAPRTAFWAAAARIVADTFGGNVYLDGDDAGTPTYGVPARDNRGGSWSEDRDAAALARTQRRLSAIAPIGRADMAAAEAELAALGE